jgi:transposase-like protein
MAATGSITALPGVIDGFVIAPQMDSTQAADPFVQQLIAENAQLRAERDQLTSINARLSRKRATLRDGVAVLAERIKSERE